MGPEEESCHHESVRRSMRRFERRERSRAMTRLLRQRHRTMVFTLGVLVPVAFVAGVAARRPVPLARSVPTELESKAFGFGTEVWTKADLWPNQRIVTSLRRNADGSV